MEWHKYSKEICCRCHTTFHRVREGKVEIIDFFLGPFAYLLAHVINVYMTRNFFNVQVKLIL